MTEPRGTLEDQLPIEWTRAVNATVWSGEREYIDFTSGIFVANVGHSHPDVIQALRDQLDHQLLHTYTFPSASRMRLARKLCQISGYERAFLCNTGAEAVEAAIRVARKVTGRPLVVSWRDSMHGKTLGAQHLMWGHPGTVWQLSREEPWCPPEEAAAVVMETYEGWSARFFEAAYVQEVATWCREVGALLILDEVQAGFGRTGKLFGYEHYGVRPDLVCIGKGLGGGLPMAGVLGSAAVLDADPTLSSTHTGNPLCCAAALATIETIEREGLVDRAASLGRRIGERLTDWPYPVQGKGFVWAITHPDADAVVRRAADAGLLLLLTRRGTVKIGPPLTIPEDQLWQGLDILESCL